MTAYPGYIPPNTELQVNDYTTSPSGVYYGVLVSQPVYPNATTPYFWIVPGSNPSTCCNGYMPLTQVSNASLGGYFAHMQTDGNFVVYTSANGQDQGTVVPVLSLNSQQSSQGSYFAQVGDDGSFSVYQGANPQSNPLKIFTAANNSHGPVTGITLNSVTYDFQHADILSQTAVGLYNADFTNTTAQPQQQVAQQNVSYTQTASFSFSVADSVGEAISADTTIGVPGIVKDSLNFTITNTTTITHGKADSQSSTVTFIAGSRPVIPAYSTYNVQITGTAESYSIPYAWTGVATYQDGTTAGVSGGGTFKGGSEGNFQVVTTCVIAIPPAVCAPGLSVTSAEILPAPEPAPLLILPLALLATAMIRRTRVRSAGP